jgi:hypothetical protein
MPASTIGSCAGFWYRRFQVRILGGQLAPVAQLAEQWTFNPRVVGSSPTGCTEAHKPLCPIPVQASDRKDGDF